jgi:hypothetical protein
MGLWSYAIEHRIMAGRIMAGQAFAAANALQGAGRRGELQRAGGDSRCWEILRATRRGICRTIERIGGVVRGRAYTKESAECCYPKTACKEKKLGFR